MIRDVKTPLGVVRLSQEGDRLSSCVFTESSDVCANESSPLLLEAENQLCAYFEGTLKEFTLPLEIKGTDFDRLVVHTLMEVPYGQTRSYGDIASQIGHPKASRAVGHACSRNPLLILVPCHRVLAAGGKLNGYAGGVKRKRALLELEGASYRE